MTVVGGRGGGERKYFSRCFHVLSKHWLGNATTSLDYCPEVQEFYPYFVARTQSHKDRDLPEVICKLPNCPVGKGTVPAVRLYLLMWVVRVATIQDHFRSSSQGAWIRVLFAYSDRQHPFVGCDKYCMCGFRSLSR